MIMPIIVDSSIVKPLRKIEFIKNEMDLHHLTKNDAN